MWARGDCVFFHNCILSEGGVWRLNPGALIRTKSLINVDWHLFSCALIRTLCRRKWPSVKTMFQVPQSEVLIILKSCWSYPYDHPESCWSYHGCHRVKMTAWLPQSVDDRLNLAGSGFCWVHWWPGTSVGLWVPTPSVGRGILLKNKELNLKIINPSIF